MPTIDAYLTSIQDAVSCIEAKARNGWPADDKQRAEVSARLNDIDSRLWELCEEGKAT